MMVRMKGVDGPFCDGSDWIEYPFCPDGFLAMRTAAGAQAFHLGELRYDPALIKDFDVGDLARVLDLDPSRFVPPVVTPMGEVVEGAAYLEALKLCRRPMVWAALSSAPRPSERILDHLIFFHDLHWNEHELVAVFDRFEDALNDALAHPAGPRGAIWRVEYSRLQKDLVRVIVRGSLTSENDLPRLTAPLHGLLDDLRKRAGSIRSLNGWTKILLRPESPGDTPS